MWKEIFHPFLKYNILPSALGSLSIILSTSFCILKIQRHSSCNAYMVSQAFPLGENMWLIIGLVAMRNDYILGAWFSLNFENVVLSKLIYHAQRIMLTHKMFLRGYLRKLSYNYYRNRYLELLTESMCQRVFNSLY